VTYLSPILPLLTIGTNGPINNFGVRNGNNNIYATGGTGMACSTTPAGVQSCYPIGPGKGIVGGPSNPVQARGTTIPSGLFSGWQYWQATVTMQLALSLIALIVGAILLSPIRRLPWRRRTAAPVTT